MARARRCCVTPPLSALATTPRIEGRLPLPPPENHVVDIPSRAAQCRIFYLFWRGRGASPLAFSSAREGCQVSPFLSWMYRLKKKKKCVHEVQTYLRVLVRVSLLTESPRSVARACGGLPLGCASCSTKERLNGTHRHSTTPPELAGPTSRLSSAVSRLTGPPTGAPSASRGTHWEVLTLTTGSTSAHRGSRLPSPRRCCACRRHQEHQLLARPLPPPPSPPPPPPLPPSGSGSGSGRSAWRHHHLSRG